MYFVGQGKNRKPVPNWKFAIAKKKADWPQGFMVTEDEYDAAETSAGGIKLGFGKKPAPEVTPPSPPVMVPAPEPPPPPAPEPTTMYS